MIKLLGIPFDANSSFLKGPALAPARIRLMDTDGSANRFAENGAEIIPGKTYHDRGDIHFADTNPSRAFTAIRERVAAEVSGNARLLCLGGDHSISYPVIDAFAEQYPNLTVLHLDAHADLYENFDDNPYSHASPFARLMEKRRIQTLVQVGIRTLTTHQRQQADKFGVRIVEARDFSLNFLPGLTGPLYISLDLDVLDPAFAPGVSHHEPGGLSTREVLSILRQIPVPVVGADIVEYNPSRDIHSMTAMVGYKLLKELIAKMAE
jgi:arginase